MEGGHAFDRSPNRFVDAVSPVQGDDYDSSDMSPSPLRRRRESIVCPISRMCGDLSVLQNSLRFLTSRDLCAVRRVCQAWLRAAEAPLLWDNVLGEEFKNVPRAWLHPNRFGESQSLRACSLHTLKSLNSVNAFEIPRGPQGREGHAMCIHDPTGLTVMWCGFVTDPDLHWCEIPESVTPANFPRWTRARPEPAPSFRYGHRMCALLDGTTEWNGPTFLCTGGTTMGGYRGMVWRPALLRAKRAEGGSWELSWEEVHTGAEHPVAYHSMTVDAETGHVWISGGLREGQLVQNVVYMEYDKEGEEWQFRVLPHCVSLPRARFGHSSSVFRGNLYVCGGYTGSGIHARYDGDDLNDIWVTSVRPGGLGWREIDVGRRRPRCLGRCHAAAAMFGGSHIVFYGGNSNPCSELAVLNLESRELKRVKVLTRWPIPQSDRLSHQMVSRGSSLIVWGGCFVGRGHDQLPNATLVFDFSTIDGEDAARENLLAVVRRQAGAATPCVASQLAPPLMPSPPSLRSGCCECA
eukprot:Hpha_TRINITY_DN12071_c0_g1::TRINITY_DN12071_c0_g1_i3::g.141047::m.141047